MLQAERIKAVAAGEHTEETMSFVPTVKAATRHKFPQEEKIRIVWRDFAER